MTGLALKLSVVIPCYNAEDTLAAQLEALAVQEWSSPWEVILSDNRSTDNSRAIAEGYCGIIPRFRIINASERQGQPFALNTGIQEARAEAVALADADDEVAPGWVAAIGEALCEHEIVGSRFDTNKLNLDWVRKARPNPQANGLQEYNYPPFLTHVAGSGLGFQRSLFFKLGGFDESLPFLHDTDFCWRAQLAGHKIHFAHKALIYYRYRSTLSGIYRQAKNYGEFNIILHNRYRKNGIPHLSPAVEIKSWYNILKNIKNNRQKADWAHWVWRMGMKTGRVKASMKNLMTEP